MKTTSETNKQRGLRKIRERDLIVRDVKALIEAFILPEPKNLTEKQQAALDNLVGTMLDIGE